MKITFVTSNEHKAREASGILAGLAEVDHVPLECPEIRDDSVAVVAEGKGLLCVLLSEPPGYL